MKTKLKFSTLFTILIQSDNEELISFAVKYVRSERMSVHFADNNMDMVALPYFLGIIDLSVLYKLNKQTKPLFIESLSYSTTSQISFIIYKDVAKPIPKYIQKFLLKGFKKYTYEDFFRCAEKQREKNIKFAEKDLKKKLLNAEKLWG